MESNKKGKVYIISAPSGTGKSSIIERVMKRRDNIGFSVSATTRLRRANETEGVDYYFKSKPQFQKMIKNGELLEYTEYAGNYYGTPVKSVYDRMEQGLDTILDIEVNGFKQVKEKIPEAISIFIVPPSLEELERRLRKRGTETEFEIERRMDAAVEQLAEMEKYDYIVENDILANAVLQVMLIMISQDKLDNNK